MGTLPVVRLFPSATTCAINLPHRISINRTKIFIRCAMPLGIIIAQTAAILAVRNGTADLIADVYPLKRHPMLVTAFGAFDMPATFSRTDKNLLADLRSFRCVGCRLFRINVRLLLLLMLAASCTLAKPPVVVLFIALYRLKRSKTAAEFVVMLGSCYVAECLALALTMCTLGFKPVIITLGVFAARKPRRMEGYIRCRRGAFAILTPFALARCASIG